ncbi:hypothetical protein [uncultured Rubinisphaera sp.]|uniref:hypothetical protein n=1 Tax=uncultured Rubinisphaera sp. TaxID=1678686 RepID=UPI000EEE58AE|nr:hypothetical protein [Planctomycetaceae bacterium]|tara:strand:- start:449 stop:886 length:438 start_codon:yes stop_codon:yes gene_type:complete
MDAKLNRLQVLQKYSPRIAHRIELISAEELEKIETLDCGILFVMAFWAGTSVRMFEALGRVLREVDEMEKIKLLVVDTDELTDSYKTPPFNSVTMGGNGETFWIRNGEVVYDSKGGLNLECIEPNTLDLVRDCTKQHHTIPGEPA